MWPCRPRLQFLTGFLAPFGPDLMLTQVQQVGRSLFLPGARKGPSCLQPTSCRLLVGGVTVSRCLWMVPAGGLDCGHCPVSLALHLVLRDVPQSPAVPALQELCFLLRAILSLPRTPPHCPAGLPRRTSLSHESLDESLSGSGFSRGPPPRTASPGGSCGGERPLPSGPAPAQGCPPGSLPCSHPCGSSTCGAGPVFWLGSPGSAWQSLPGPCRRVSACPARSGAAA